MGVICNAPAVATHFLSMPASRPRPGARWPSPGKPRNEACFNRPCAAVQPGAQSKTRSATRRPADAAQSARSASPSRLVALGPYAGHTQAHPQAEVRPHPSKYGTAHASAVWKRRKEISQHRKLSAKWDRQGRRRPPPRRWGQ